MAYTNCDLILSVKDAEDHKKWLKVRNMGMAAVMRLSLWD